MSSNGMLDVLKKRALSSFDGMLGTNYVPTAAQTKEIKAHIEESKVALSAMRTTMTRLRCMLDQLESNEAETRKYVEDCEALITLARRMPPEIVSTIFEYCIPPEGSRPSVSEPPLLLSRVCRQWREVALATPQLWSAIRLHLPANISDWDMALFMHVQALQFWLDHSGTLRLELAITHDIHPSILINHFDQERFLFTSVAYQLLFDHIQSNCHRLLTLSVTMPIYFFHHFSLIFGQPLPVLEEVSLRPSDIPLQSGHLPIINFCNADRLRLLSTTIPFHRIGDFHVPWHQLTRLRLKEEHPTQFSLSLNDYFSILQHCTHLEVCTLHIFDGLFRRPTPPLIIPSLQDFQLHVVMFFQSRDSRLGDFLSSLVLPHLKRLHISCAVIPRPVQVPPGIYQLELTNFLLRTRRQLQALTLKDVPITSSEIFACCLISPQVTYLTLLPMSPLKIDSEIIQALTPVDDIPALCPKLKVLGLGFGSLFESDPLLEMVSVRKGRLPSDESGVTALNSVTIVLYRNHFPSPPPDTDTRMARYKSRLQYALTNGTADVVWG